MSLAIINYGEMGINHDISRSRLGGGRFIQEVRAGSAIACQLDDPMPSAGERSSLVSARLRRAFMGDRHVQACSSLAFCGC